jgi:hypothetical protein
MRGLLAAVAIVGGALLLRRGSADDGTSTDEPSGPVYGIWEFDEGWYVVEDEAIVCGPLVTEFQAQDSLKRWKSTRHC